MGRPNSPGTGDEFAVWDCLVYIVGWVAGSFFGDSAHP